ncbi:MAG: hypothetical protein AAF892_11350, partial [Cyanobacteria bacterium P01_D01_bin.71]
MSLSNLCVEQHERERTGLRKLLLLGLLGSVGLHAIAFGIGAFGLWQRLADAEPPAIELLVMEPPPEPEEPEPDTAPAELSDETNDPAPAAAAANQDVAAAAPAPPPPAEIVEPEPIPETAVESELTEPEESEEEETETTEDPEEPPEQVAAVPNELDASQLERLRNFFDRTRGTDPDATATDGAASDGTDESP